MDVIFLRYKYSAHGVLGGEDAQIITQEFVQEIGQDNMHGRVLVKFRNDKQCDLKSAKFVTYL